MKRHFIIISRLAAYAFIAASLSGCTGMTVAHLSDNGKHDQRAQRDEREKLWMDNKDWLLSRLPKTEPLVWDIVSALQEIPGSEYSCPDPSDANCGKLFNLLRQKMSASRFVQLPDGSGRIALLDGDTAYVFRMTDWTFSGIANLPTALYFTVQNVPLRRADGLSFAFVADDKTDTASLWTIYRRNILEDDRGVSPGWEYILTRAELDAAGVPKQIDLLTPQQRNERELAKQGIAWRRRAQIKAIRMCSAKPEPGNGSRKSGGGGGRGKHNRSASPESSTTGSPPASASSMEEALQGKSHFNCNAGSGYVVTEDGIAAEVYRIVRSKGGVDAIISATAKEIPGGVIQYKYPFEQDDVLKPDAGKDMALQIQTMKGSNKLNLNLRADTGAGTGFLVLVGDWYLGPDYRIRGKIVSNAKFATFFIRAYRDCAMKDSQGNCKSIPDLFMSLQNPRIAEEYVQYISDHYLSGAEEGR